MGGGSLRVPLVPLRQRGVEKKKGEGEGKRRRKTSGAGAVANPPARAQMRVAPPVVPAIIEIRGVGGTSCNEP